MSDVIFSPAHYTAHPSGIQPMEIAKHETFLRGNIIKYVMRAPYKGKEIEDLKKARQNLDLEIERAEKAYLAETAENVEHPVGEKEYAPIEWRAQSDLKHASHQSARVDPVMSIVEASQYLEDRAQALESQRSRH